MQWTEEVDQGAGVILSDVLDVGVAKHDMHILEDVGVWHTRLTGTGLKSRVRCGCGISNVLDVGAGKPDMCILEDVAVQHAGKLNLHG